jgi:Flp pilus assembly protein protease CpaA
MVDLLTAIVVIIAFTAMFIGSITDLKTREVPDWLNFSLIAMGLGVRTIFSVVQWDYHPILNGLIGLGVFVALGYLMFYTGQWGGGDSKMLMGLGALIGWDFSFDHFIINFGIALVFVGALYGILWSFGLIIFNFKKFIKKVREYLHNKKIFPIRIVTMAVATIGIIAAFVVPNTAMRLVIITAVLFIYASLYLYVFSKALEEVCMIKTVPISKVTEGDWIVGVVKHNDKVLASSKDLGIKLEQIQAIKNAKIKQITIKEGIPFVPSFLLAFLVALEYGNILIVLTSLL